MGRNDVSETFALLLRALSPFPDMRVFGPSQRRCSPVSVIEFAIERGGYAQLKM
jgi:hypothetical protein